MHIPIQHPFDPVAVGIPVHQCSVSSFLLSWTYACKTSAGTGMGAEVGTPVGRKPCAVGLGSIAGIGMGERKRLVEGR